MRSQYFLPFVLAVLAGLCFVSCMKEQKPSPPVVERPQSLLHTILYEGETLGLISLWYTGAVDNWSDILAINAGLDPNRLKLGDVVAIPRTLLIREEALPQSFLARQPSFKRNEEALAGKTNGSDSMALGENEGLSEGQEPPAVDVASPDEPPSDPEVEMERSRLLKELLGE